GRMVNVNLSLDEIIRDNKGRRASAGNPVTRRPLNSVRTGFIKKSASSTAIGNKWGHSGFDEMYGGRKTTTVISRVSSGPVKVDISNLNNYITTADLEELFAQYPFTKIHVHFDESGSSIGTGAITLKSRNDAERLVNDFRGCKVDGKAIQMSIVDSKRPALKVERPAAVSRPKVFSQVQRHSRPVQQRGWMHDNRFATAEKAVTTNGRGGAKGGKKAGYTEAELDAELDAYMKK
ncbi:hypothetical protein PFISCL1PPCAC_7965, partial [Pristionchus fissidentatus]